MDDKNIKNPQNIKVVQGDGKDLDISPVYDHIKDIEPKSSQKKPKNIVIPKKGN